MRRVLLLSSAAWICFCSKVDDSVHYAVNFRSIEDVDLPSGGSLLKLDLPQTKETLTISTPNHETFVCHIPVVSDEESKKRITSFTGPSPRELIEPIYAEKMCSYRLEPYWSYELCHGRFLLQYHEEKELKMTVRTEYYLGNFHVDYATKAGYQFDQLNPPTRMIDGVQLAYFPVAYTQGSNCDITGKPRTTTVVYICDQEGRENIHSVTEVSSCHYEAIVLTSRLCSHPAFAPPKRQKYDIICYDKDGRKNPKPVSLIEQEEKHANTFKTEFVGKSKVSESSLDAKAEQLAAILDQEFEQWQKRRLEENVAISQKSAPKDLGVKTSSSGPTRRTASNRPQDTGESERINEQIASDTINRILTGKECIQGGGGWWKYEFCYGRSVTQVHVEPNGERTEILLGVFDKAVHKAWIQQNEKKRPLKYQGKVQQISQIFVKGDMCQETRAHRSVEVKLRCKTVDGSKLAIAVSLEEPQVCRYVLTVESERFCTILQSVNDDGLLDTETLAEKSRLGTLV